MPVSCDETLLTIFLAIPLDCGNLDLVDFGAFFGKHNNTLRSACDGGVLFDLYVHMCLGSRSSATLQLGCQRLFQGFIKCESL